MGVGKKRQAFARVLHTLNSEICYLGGGIQEPWRGGEQFTTLDLQYYKNLRNERAIDDVEVLK